MCAHFLTNLFFLSLLIPNPPFFSMQFFFVHLKSVIIYQRLSKMSGQYENDIDIVNFKSLTMLDDRSMQKMAKSSRMSNEQGKNKSRVQNLIIRNGVLTKLDEDQLNKIANQTKVIGCFTLSNHSEERSNISLNHEAKNILVQQDDQLQSVKKYIKRRQSFIQQSTMHNQYMQDYINDDYCRIFYEKVALENKVGALEEESRRKNEIINHLRHKLELQCNSQRIVPNQSHNMMLVNPYTTIIHQQNTFVQSFQAHTPFHRRQFQTNMNQPHQIIIPNNYAIPRYF